MNKQENFNPDGPAPLLEAIKVIRATVEDGLNDQELTAFLGRIALPAEAGFSFLSFWDGYVTMSVPRQDTGEWYSKQGGILPDKVETARLLSEKYGLSLFEPVDATCRIYQNGGDNIHHHLEFADCRQTVIVAHPCYLRVRLFGISPEHRYARETLTPLPLGPGLLQDLSKLYRCGFKPPRLGYCESCQIN